MKVKSPPLMDPTKPTVANLMYNYDLNKSIAEREKVANKVPIYSHIKDINEYNKNIRLQNLKSIRNNQKSR